MKLSGFCCMLLALCLVLAVPTAHAELKVYADTTQCGHVYRLTNLTRYATDDVETYEATCLVCLKKVTGIYGALYKADAQPCDPAACAHVYKLSAEPKRMTVEDVVLSVSPLLGWHQPAAYYDATCINCNDTFECHELVGEHENHAYELIADYHSAGTEHILVERCEGCGRCSVTVIDNCKLLAGNEALACEFGMWKYIPEE